MRLKIELELEDEQFDSDRMRNDLKVMKETLGLFTCVRAVTEFSVDIPTDQYIVHYNDRYAKVVSAKNPNEASEKVKNGEGETMFYEREEVAIEEYP